MLVLKQTAANSTNITREAEAFYPTLTEVDGLLGYLIRREFTAISVMLISQEELQAAISG